MALKYLKNILLTIDDLLKTISKAKTDKWESRLHLHRG